MRFRVRCDNIFYTMAHACVSFLSGAGQTPKHINHPSCHLSRTFGELRAARGCGEKGEWDRMGGWIPWSLTTPQTSANSAERIVRKLQENGHYLTFVSSSRYFWLLLAFFPSSFCAPKLNLMTSWLYCWCVQKSLFMRSFKLRSRRKRIHPQRIVKQWESNGFFRSPVFANLHSRPTSPKFYLTLKWHWVRNTITGHNGQTLFY